MDKIESGSEEQLEPKHNPDSSESVKISKSRMWQGVAGFFFLTTIILFFFPISPFVDNGITGNVVNTGAMESGNNEKNTINNNDNNENSNNGNTDHEDNQENEPQRFEVSVDDDPSLGSDDAPVTIVAFEDYQCPFCKRAAVEVLPRIKEEYIDSGKVKFVFRDFPLAGIHPEAVASAEASECADEQGTFWEYHDYLYSNQNQLGRAVYEEIAKTLELDMEKFNSCLDNRDQQYEVENDFSQGVASGVDATPAYFINGIKIVGSHPYENFKKIIDSELS